MSLSNTLLKVKELLLGFVVLGRIGAAFGWLAGGGALSTVLMAISTFAVAGQVGAEAFGTIAIISSIVYFTAGILSLRTTESITKFLTDAIALHQQKKAKCLITIGLLIDFLSAVLTCGLLYGFSEQLATQFLSHESDARWLELFLVIPLLTFGYPTTLAVLRVANKFSLIAIIDISVSFLTLSGTLFLIYYNAEWPYFLLITVLVAGVKGIMTLCFLSRECARLNITPGLYGNVIELIAELKEPFRLMFTTTAVNILKTAHNNLDILLVGNMLGAESSGAYKLARSFIQILSFPTNALFQISFPDFAESIVKGLIAKFKETLRLLLNATIGLTILYCALVWFLMPLIFSLLVGPEYEQGAHIMPVMIVGLSAMLVSQYWHAGLVATNAAEQVALSMAVALVLELAVFLVCIPTFGILGAALGYVTYCAIRGLFLYNRFDIYVIKKLHDGTS